MIPDVGVPPTLVRSTNSRDSKEEEKYSEEDIYLAFLEEVTPPNLPLPLITTFIRSKLWKQMYSC